MQVESKRMEKKVYHANTAENKARVATLILNKVDFRVKKVSETERDIL